jgi:hydrogenase nickel incorporation protein HypA/HybF
MQLTESVQNLIDKAVRLAAGQPIKTIRATLGELTGLTVDQVHAAFERYRVDTLAANAMLHLQLEPARVVCLSCEQVVPTHADGQACAACGSYRRQAIAGQQLVVEGVSIDRSASVTRRTGPKRAGRVAPQESVGQPALATWPPDGDWDE